MGGRQSTQSNTPRQASSQTNQQRHSVSLDQTTSNSSRFSSLFGGPSNNAQISSTPPERGVIRSRRRRRDRNDLLIEAHSLPSHLFSAMLADIKCPVCNKRIGSDEIESHLITCLSKPRVSYNEDVLKADAGECIICFDDMCAGEYIARLPCLCIYHKKCIDDWFQRNRCCPEHPDQIPNEHTTSSASQSTNNIQDNREESTSETLGATAMDASTENNEASHAAVFMPDLELDDRQNDTSSDVSPSAAVSSDVAQNRQDTHPLPEIVILDSTLREEDDSVAPQTLTRQVSSPTATPGKTIVHVDDGSIHGSPTLFDEDELDQLTTKIKTILVAESPRGQEVNNT